MKNLLTIIVFGCVVQFVNGQTLIPPEPASKLEELGLSGPIKEIVEYVYQTNKDTTNRRWKTIYEFDRDGKLRTEATYSPGGSQVSHCTWDYSKSDSVIIQQFNFSGKLSNTLILKYDQDQKLVEADQLTFPPGIVEFRTVFKYDTKGNEIERNMPGDKDEVTDTSIYNEKNQKITETIKRKLFNDESRVIFSYDTLGRLIKEENFDKNDSVAMTGIKYSRHDKFGNWLFNITINDPQGTAATFLSNSFNQTGIHQTSAVDFKSQTVTERQIKYYDR